ncbi:hypothetical protein BY458DRAFT_550606 [Sporodiniella umbellata]|nr:hypothetical protein BY458DRAFT_550606 [Sporodiniella umbellata]
MIRAQRIIYYLLFLAVFVFLLLNLFPRLKSNTRLGSQTSSSGEESTRKKKVDPNEERYLSWFPHGGFPEQQECFRSGIRLALETNRTMIAPMLRIQQNYPWMPFEALAKRYEAQEKSSLRQACQEKQKNAQTALEPCETLNEWTEIPWSSVMDLDALRKDFGVRIIERVQGHGWGVHESALGGGLAAEDVVVVDVMSFKENGTDWEHVDPALAALERSKKPGVPSWGGWFGAGKTTLKEPLKFVFDENKLHGLDAKLVQFGALSTAARYATPPSEVQLRLRKSLMKTHFNRPDQMRSLTAQANRIVEALGGQMEYSTLLLDFTRLVAADTRASQYPQGIESMDAQAKKELMDALVREIYGDIPINQAVSAAMPIQSSKLSGFLKGRTFPIQGVAARQQLLEACVDYHQHIERRYPVYFLISDLDVAPETRTDLFGPLLDMFPCTFSKHDMLNFGIQTPHWAAGQPGLTDTVEYERLLQPLLDILVAGKGYSFFEIPTTPLTRFLNWSLKEK